MQVKGRFLEKYNWVIFLFSVFLISKIVVADNIKSKLLNYNIDLKNSYADFIQTDGQTFEEGIIYFGLERIKIEYIKPSKITIILSKRRGMYVNHDLKETQFFSTNKTFLKDFIKILNGEKFFEDSDIFILDDSITIKNYVEINTTPYNTEIIYENAPIKLRKLKVTENNESFELGFFNHISIEKFDKNFFYLINPYLENQP